MSQLGALKSQIEALAAQASGTAGGLEGFKSTFSDSIAAVEATIGGSARGEDKRLIETLKSASDKVEAAAAALRQAASSARSYGASL